MAVTMDSSARRRSEPTDNHCGNPGRATLQQQLTDMIRKRPDDIAGALPEPVGMA